MASTNTQQPNHITEDNFIGFYGHAKGPYRCFSNFYPCEIVGPNDIKYICSEQYIMAQKAILFGDNQAFLAIINSSIPKNIKMLGRLVIGFNNEIWKKNRERIAEECLYLKFKQHSKIRQTLLGTGNKYIAECSPFDKIWGIGYGVNQALNHQNNWGKNILGLSLMKVRERLRNEGC